MLFVIRCTDKPGHQDVRKANRDSHIALLEEYGERILAAGPTLDDNGESMTGSVIIMDAPDRAAVDAFLSSDPYAKAGLFETVEVSRWKKVLPAG
jgi:hypothetical protein